jgi:ethanolamine utilization protein EutN
MRIAKVIGTVTLNREHPSLAGARYKLVVPLSLDDLTGKSQPAGDEFAVYDDLGAGVGHLIAVSEGAEAAQPFYPQTKPIDAYDAAILDNVNIHLPKEPS